MQNHRYIELCGYGANELQGAQAEIRAIRSPLAQYREWDESLLAQGLLPDVSVIDARDKSWADIAILANRAHGHRIVLVGSDAPRIGLHVVPTASSLEEAIDEALHDSGFGADRAPDTLPTPLTETQPLRPF